jgi:hypothetical protein
MNGASMHRVIETFRRLVSAVHQGERGDVPGWVMITLMSAVLVAGLLVLAQDAFRALFEQAISQVTQS